VCNEMKRYHIRVGTYIQLEHLGMYEWNFINSE
jgi:hypothetical protein